MHAYCKRAYLLLHAQADRTEPARRLDRTQGPGARRTTRAAGRPGCPA
jgi:hypothetical protein